MDYFLIPLFCISAACLTFFTGFGLGSLLLPVFVWKFGSVAAVPLVAIVHLLNSLYKASLTARSADRSVLIRFGVGALLGTPCGALLLIQLSTLASLQPYASLGYYASVSPIKLVVGWIMAAIAVVEVSGGLKSLGIGAKWLYVGGMLSGFFGGLTGHQGAFRTIFLVKSGLSKEAMIGTGAVLACVIDITRITLYSSLLPAANIVANSTWIVLAAAGAFAGTLAASRFLTKVSMPALERLISAGLVLFGICLGCGLL